MSLSNPNALVTEQRLNEFYNGILPYIGGNTDAGFTPVGTIISVMGVTAPANYLKCDGTVYNIADYPELSDYFYEQFGSKNKFGGNGTTTFAVPDLRGEFLRGTGTNSHTIDGSGNGANVGTHQAPTVIPCFVSNKTNHKIGILGNTGGDINVWNGDGSFVKYSDGTRGWQIASNCTDQATGLTYDNVSTRPANTSVLFCIATKNIYLNPSLDYSTSEKVVGTWIDGKPLYQKTIEIDISSNETPATTRQSIMLYDTTALSPDIVMIDNSSFVMSSGSSWSSLSHINSSNPVSYCCTLISHTNKKVYLVIEGSNYYAQACGKTGGKVILTIQYTKTTD